jgi:hypothetical protein
VGENPSPGTETLRPLPGHRPRRFLFVAGKRLGLREEHALHVRRLPDHHPTHAGDRGRKVYRRRTRRREPPERLVKETPPFVRRAVAQPSGLEDRAVGRGHADERRAAHDEVADGREHIVETPALDPDVLGGRPTLIEEAKASRLPAERVWKGRARRTGGGHGRWTTRTRLAILSLRSRRLAAFCYSPRAPLPVP